MSLIDDIINNAKKEILKQNIPSSTQKSTLSIFDKYLDRPSVFQKSKQLFNEIKTKEELVKKIKESAKKVNNSIVFDFWWQDYKLIILINKDTVIISGLKEVLKKIYDIIDIDIEQEISLKQIDL